MPILLLLILQLSFASTFASNFLSKAVIYSGIGFSKKSISDFSNGDCRENIIFENVSCLSGKNQIDSQYFVASMKKNEYKINHRPTLI
jgi:hypothetical protein